MYEMEMKSNGTVHVTFDGFTVIHIYAEVNGKRIDAEKIGKRIVSALNYRAEIPAFQQ